MKLPRIPTWDELFQAVHTAVESLPAGICELGPFHYLISDDARDGRCPIYSGLVWAIFQMMLENGSGINLGRIVIKIQGPRGQGVYTIPPQGKEPSLISGGFHAWCMLERSPGKPDPGEDDVFIVDFGYHWFQSSRDKDVLVSGPERFLIATPNSLYENGISYQADDSMSEEITKAVELEDFTDLLLDFGVELRQLMAS